MRNFALLIALFLAAALSCSDNDGWRADAPRGFSEYGGSAPGGNAVTPPKDTAIFTLCVEYPADYDWQRDSAPGMADRALVLFRGQKRVLEIDAGGTEGIRPDPDMNRLCRGQVYSDFNAGNSTVICLNGQELFRYEGREMLMGFAVRGAHVYTLGMARSGNGISFRKDGEALLEDPDGVLRGHGTAGMGQEGLLKDDGGALTFWYEATVGNRLRRYMVTDGMKREVELESYVKKVHEIRSIGGETAMLISTDASRERPVLCYGGSSMQLGRDSYPQALSSLTGCRIIPSEKGLYVLEGHRFTVGQKVEHCLWDPSGKLVLCCEDMAGLMMDGNELALVRKKGKLPRETVSASYELEYGTAEIEMHTDSIRRGQKVILIDDLIATGGTIEAAAKLVEQLGGEVVKMIFLLELAGLKGREKLSGYDVASVVSYEGK